MPYVQPVFLLNKAAASIASSATIDVTTFGQTIPRGATVYAAIGAGNAGTFVPSGVADNSTQDGDANVYSNIGNNTDAQTDCISVYVSTLNRAILTGDTITGTFTGSLTRKAAHVLCFTNATSTGIHGGTTNATASPITISVGDNAYPSVQVGSLLVVTGVPTTSGLSVTTPAGATTLAGVNTGQSTANVQLDMSYAFISGHNPTNDLVATLTNIASLTSDVRLGRWLNTQDPTIYSRSHYTRFG